MPKLPPNVDTNPPASSGDRRQDILLSISVFILTVLVFLPALKCDFVNYDDPETVYDSKEVISGLSIDGFKWAFTHNIAGHWDPLTTISHMVDCQLYGLQPWGHHLTNVLLHGLAASLLFLVLRRMTGALWRSAFVAALWAIHPLRVESVVWVTERKDVLSGVFFMLTLWAYARYVRQRSLARYLLVMVFVAFGLMSKSMLVTLPFVLMLLDYWPLQRHQPSIFGFQFSTFLRLFIEKLPLFTLSAVSSVVQILAAQELIASTTTVSFIARIENALVSYTAYLWKLFWPANLAVFYPHSNNLPAAQSLLAGLFLVGTSVFAVVFQKARPCLLVGWFWFIGVSLPVIGLVQAGSLSMADRYTYLPMVGVILILTWVANELSASWHYQVVICTSTAGLILLFFTILTLQQCKYWKDSETLFRHALSITSENYVAHHNLGVVLAKSNQFSEAVVEYEAAIHIRPDIAEAHYNLGIVLTKIPERERDAVSAYQSALRLNPAYAEAHNNLGSVLAKSPERLADAIHEYEAALHIKPDYSEARYNLGNAFVKTGRLSEAISEYEAALKLNPNLPQAHFNLGILLLSTPEHLVEATKHFEAALQIRPDLEPARQMLERLRMTQPIEIPKR